MAHMISLCCHQITWHMHASTRTKFYYLGHIYGISSLSHTVTYRHGLGRLRVYNGVGCAPVHHRRHYIVCSKAEQTLRATGEFSTSMQT